MKELGQEQQIRQYLLGQLVDDEQRQVEKRFMTDDRYKEAVLIVENELLEDYLTKALSESEREQFSRHFLSAPRQLEQLRIARALAERATSNTSQPSSAATGSHWFSATRGIDSRWRQYAWIGLFVVVIVGSWLLFRTWQAHTKQERLNEELAQLNKPQNIRTPGDSVLGVTLVSGSFREQGNLPRGVLTPETKIVQLRIPLPANNGQYYRATLTTIQGDRIFEFETVSNRSTQAQALILQMPVGILEANDYVLNLKGLNANGQVEELGNYGFRLLRQ